MNIFKRIKSIFNSFQKSTDMTYEDSVYDGKPQPIIENYKNNFVTFEFLYKTLQLGYTNLDCFTDTIIKNYNLKEGKDYMKNQDEEMIISCYWARDIYGRALV